MNVGSRLLALVSLGFWLPFLSGGCAEPESVTATHATYLASSTGTNFLFYDKQMIEAIQNNWYQSLEKYKYNDDRRGKVEIEFWEHSDGTVSRIKVRQNEVGITPGFICVKSIEDSAPFFSWPTNMMTGIKTNYRVITFTFNYR